MTHDEVMAKLNEIFQDVFDDDTITVYDDTTTDDIDDWDSLEHINLIEVVEHEFDMKFRMQEVSDMKDVGEMADIVVERAGTKNKKKKRR
ncbi:MAG: acyl carrier protein [Ruminococcus sp.]|nr:acyl carrier protein [Ruminococcus sp.]